MNFETLKQSLLEGGRLLVSAVVSYLLTEGVTTFIIDRFFGVRLDPAFKLQVIAAATIILKAVDRALHETTSEKGLLRF
jgi:hypothetical protein